MPDIPRPSEARTWYMTHIPRGPPHIPRGPSHIPRGAAEWNMGWSEWNMGWSEWNMRKIKQGDIHETKLIHEWQQLIFHEA